MKIRIFTFLISLFFILGIGNNVFGQAVGDYGSSGTMNWNGGTWNVCVTPGTWSGATTTTTAPTAAQNVWILAGHSVTLATTAGSCKNLDVAGTLTASISPTIMGNINVTGTLTFSANIISGDHTTSGTTITVAAGGIMTSGNGTRLFIRGLAGSTTTITNNGTFGAATAGVNVGTKITMGGNNNGTDNGSVNLILTGTGTTILNSILVDWNAPNSSITIDQDLTITPNSNAAAVKLAGNTNLVTASSVRTFTINSGKTVTIYAASTGWFANTAQYTGIDATNVYNINGTLDLTGASLYFGCTTNTTAGATGATNSQTFNIGSSGLLKCGNVTKVEKPQATQTLAVNVASGGTITYAGTAYQTLPTTSTYAVTASPYALLTNSNSNLSFTNASSAVTMNTDLNVSGNLVLSASGTWSGTGKTIMTGAGKTISAGTLGNLEIATGAVGNIITTSGALTANGDVTVSTGTLKLGANLTTYNVSVASGAVLTANIGSNSGSRRTLTVGAGTAGNDATVTVNGTLGGTKWSTDGIDIEVSANAKSFTLDGTGTIAISGIRPAANANSRALDIYLNRSLYLSRDNGGAANIEPALTLQNGTCTFNRTLTVSNGVTLTFQGNAGLHGKRNDPNSSDELLYNYASSSSNQGNCTYNINGIMDLRSYSTGAICNLNTTSYAGNTQSVTLNVGSTGVLKLGRVIKMYTALSGQTVSIVPATGSTVEYGGTTAATILLTTGTGTAPTLPAAYSNLSISNTNGITLPTDFSVSGTMAIDESLAGGTITLLPLANATVASGKTLTANILNLNSNSSGTATLLNNGTATITTANVEQYLPHARNWYVSSPVTGATVPAAYTCYSYDERGLNSGYTAPATAYWVSEPQGNTFAVGKGYIALPGSAGSTLTFTGTLNSGNKDVALTYSGATKTGFNLIGNPYPCHLGWTYDFVNANSSLIESSIWVRTNAGTTNNSGQWSFATFNATSAESVPSVVNNGIIAPMQAFWVRAKTAGTLTLNSNLTKSHQSSNPLKVRAATNDHRQRIRLEVSNGTATDESLIFFDAAASNGYDDYDSPKMTNNNVDIPEIYTVVNGQKLVMNGMNGIINDMEIPIGFTTGKSNTFTLKTTQLANLDADVKVFLKDNSNSNLLTELNLNQEYTFTSDITDNANRFSLVFKAPSLATADNFIQNQSIRVFSNENNQILVENNLSIDNATMSVYNVSGQLEETRKLTGNMTISNLSYGNGVYFVTISFGNKTETTKLIINNI